MAGEKTKQLSLKIARVCVFLSLSWFVSLYAFMPGSQTDSGPQRASRMHLGCLPGRVHHARTHGGMPPKGKLMCCAARHPRPTTLHSRGHATQRKAHASPRKEAIDVLSDRLRHPPRVKCTGAGFPPPESYVAVAPRTTMANSIAELNVICQNSPHLR